MNGGEGSGVQRFINHYTRKGAKDAKEWEEKKFEARNPKFETNLNNQKFKILNGVLRI
jgi:hypothetical protein